MHKLLIVLAIIIIGINLSCDKALNENDDAMKPGRRDYVWTIDTISYPESFQTNMYTMYVYSAEKIWIAGHNYRAYGKMFFYNGNKWEPVTLPKNRGTSTIRDLIGFSDKNIYAVGSTSFMNSTYDKILDSSLISFYDGTSWKTQVSGIGGNLFTIIGSESKLYAAGMDSTFFIYDGSKWILNKLKFWIPADYNTRYVSSIIFFDESKLRLHYTCYSSNTGKELYYELDLVQDSIIKVDSFNVFDRPRWGTKLWKSLNNTIYSVNPVLYRFSKNKWEEFLTDQLYTTVGGTSDNNIFAGGRTLKHFNGSNWYEHKEFSNRFGFAQSIKCIDNMVYVLFSDGDNSYVIKGILKD
jgi:hypothetical protein